MIKGSLSIIKLFRAREVKQSYFTSVITTIIASLHSFIILLKISLFAKYKLDLIVTNGPGTALPLCYIYFFFSYILLFNLKAKILFIESFCRVNELSMTGKLLRPLFRVIRQKFIV